MIGEHFRLAHSFSCLLNSFYLICFKQSFAKKAAVFLYKKAAQHFIEYAVQLILFVYFFNNDTAFIDIIIIIAVNISAVISVSFEMLDRK